MMIKWFSHLFHRSLSLHGFSFSATWVGFPAAISSADGSFAALALTGGEQVQPRNAASDGERWRK